VPLVLEKELRIKLMASSGAEVSVHTEAEKHCRLRGDALWSMLCHLIDMACWSPDRWNPGRVIRRP
jgi:hypothetical protein